ncbi:MULTISPECIES: PepSY domain-containing protein [unclassified Bradyrhizobium]|uniref:PepSY domain-containing protein n=1 Tax=unclassified Bradyrhizobium TaxID=2631580 RepID=UPI0028E2C6E5|nr:MULTISPECIES: PepSY domain-containing protein [unclassified Bradyrhizobium]
MPSKYLRALVLTGALAFGPAHAVSIEPQSPATAQSGDDGSLSQEAVDRELDLFRKAGISLRQALRIAEKAHPGSITADISFDGALGAPLYKVRTVSSGQIFECEVDGTTAEIRNSTPFSSLQGLNEIDRRNLLALRSARLKMSDAVLIAERSAAGKAIAGGLANKDGQLNFVIIVVSKDGLKQVQLEPVPRARR